MIFSTETLTLYRHCWLTIHHFSSLPPNTPRILCWYYTLLHTTHCELHSIITAIPFFLPEVGLGMDLWSNSSQWNNKGRCAGSFWVHPQRETHIRRDVLLNNIVLGVTPGPEEVILVLWRQLAWEQSQHCLLRTADRETQNLVPWLHH